MQPDELKLPKKKPSIKDQISKSIYAAKIPKKYTLISSGIDIGVPSTVGRGFRPQQQPTPVNQENDYIENTYIDDYFE
jgi:hypothetical protein